MENKDLQLQTALWALKRIVRKRAGFVHGKIPGEARYDPKFDSCDCPQCIAKDALERIDEDAHPNVPLRGLRTGVS